MSLLPESTIAITPSLAATLGLEEAVMVAVLQQCINHFDLNTRKNKAWLTITREKILALVPFWSDIDIQRVLQSLEAKGVIALDSPPFSQASCLTVAFDLPNQSANEHFQSKNTNTPNINTNTQFKPVGALQQGATEQAYQQQSPANHRPANQGIGGNTLISPNWRPPESMLQSLQQFNNVDREFALSTVDAFVIYWTEKRATAASWSNKFRSWVLREWRDRESDFLKPFNDTATAIYREWQPSSDAMEILNRAGISSSFIEDCVPEFVLYWQERGDAHKTWNSLFIKHIRTQWARYSSATEYDSDPKRIDANWQPNGDVFDILSLANIEIDFARQLVPEFVMYWRESNKVQTSWNSKFLQHVKYRWAQRHHMPNALSTGHNNEINRSIGQRGEQKSDIIERLVDRSWAQV